MTAVPLDLYNYFGVDHQGFLHVAKLCACKGVLVRPKLYLGQGSALSILSNFPYLAHLIALNIMLEV